VVDMNPLSRRTALQTGLAAAGVLSAVAASLGLALHTHPNAGDQGGSATTQRAQDSRQGSSPGSRQGSTEGSRQGSESDDHHAARSTGSPASPPSVTAPTPSAPQATTSGS
jgi:hypothetical protein